MSEHASRSKPGAPGSMLPDDILLSPASEQADFLTCDPQRLTALADSQIRRIATLNPRLRALSHWSPEGIRRQADKVLRSFEEFRGSLLRGLGVTFKGNIPIEASPWTEGSALYRERIAPADAEIVRRVRQAGGIIFGSTTLTELAMYAPDNPSEPVALNPYDPERTPGGSSSGAAVAAATGMGAVHLGTDSGGSIRNPACHCGVVGFKPSKGLLPADGLTIYSPSLDTLGIIARSAADLAPTLQALRIDGFTAHHADEEEGPEELALLVPRSLLQQYCTEAALSGFSETLDDIAERLGARSIDVEVESWDNGQAAAGLVSMHEGGQALMRLDVSETGPAIRQRLAQAQALSPSDVAAAYETMTVCSEEIHRLMAHIPGAVIFTPTWPFAAPLIYQTAISVGSEEKPVDPWRNIFVRAANAADLPAITVPCAPLPGEAAPAGLHLMAPCNSDRNLLTAAVAVEQALSDSGRRPPPPILVKHPQATNSKEQRGDGNPYRSV